MKRPFSVSSVDTFERCKHAYYLEYYKKVPKAPNEFMKKGKRIHSHIEKFELPQDTEEQEQVKYTYQILGDRYNLKERLPWDCSFVQDDDKRNHVFLREFRFGLDRDFKPCPYFDGCFFRGVVDFVHLELSPGFNKNGGKIDDYVKTTHIIDWKSGKSAKSQFQLKVYALYFLIRYPGLESVTCEYVFLSTGESKKIEVRRNNIDKIRNKIKEKTEKISQCVEFSAKPSSFKCDLCSVRNACTHRAVGLADLKLFGVEDRR